MSDDLNVCNMCGSKQRWYDEMYWKGEECQETNAILGEHTAVCDQCFYKLGENYEGCQQ